MSSEVAKLVKTNKLATINKELVKGVYEVTENAGARAANVSVENAPQAAELLARLRRFEKDVEAQVKAAPEYVAAKKIISEYDAAKRDLTKRIAALDEAIAPKLIAALGDPSLGGSVEGPLGSTVNLIEKWIVEVVDAEAVPESMLLPLPTRAERVNVKAALAAMETGAAVPGLRLAPNHHLTTRSKDGIS